MTDSEQLPARLLSVVGRSLEPGVVCIPAEESALLAEALGSPTTGDALHPVYGYIAAQRGIGVTVAELCALAEFDVDDGPMLASVDLRFDADLRPGVEYRVEGSITDLVRKRGKVAGLFDLLSFEERIIDAEGTVAVAATVSFILPRKESA